MTRVTVALLGPREHAFNTEAIFDEGDPRLSWEERDQVEIDVADDETLGGALQRAGDQLGVEVPWSDGNAPVPTFVSIYESSHDGADYIPYSHVVTLVDEAGHARWNVPYESVKYGDLKRAIEAGAMEGDPRRLYYVVHPGVGNGMVATWAILLLALNSTYAAMQVAATVEGTLAFGKRVLNAARERIRPGREVIEANALKWEQRGGDQAAVRRMLRNRLWHPADAARLLDCTENEAEAVLWTLGFAKDKDLGLWKRGGDEAAALLDEALDEVDLTYNLGHEGFQKTFAARTEHLLQTGKRAPMPGIDAEELGDHKLVPSDVFDGGDDVDEMEGEELPPDERLPLDHLLVRCACGKDACKAVAGIGIANGRLKLGFTGTTDHFVIDPHFLERAALQIGFDIEAAKSGTD